MFRKLFSIIISAAFLFGLASVLPDELNNNLGIEIEANADNTYGDYKYTVLNDGTVEITQYNGSASSITIPSKINGKTVTSIGALAFRHMGLMGQPVIKSIILPDTITTIKEYAFAQNGLESIKIPKSLQFIGDYAFHNTCIKELNIPSSVNSIGTGAFLYCHELKKANIDCKEIGFDAFYCCENLSSLKFGNNVQYIRNAAFKECSSLKKLTIPSNVRGIGESAFEQCTALTEVNLSEGLSYVDGGAFIGCEKVKSISIPKSVEYLGSASFGIAGRGDGDGCLVPGFIVYGQKGSVAESYAKKERLIFIAQKDLSTCKVTIPYSSYTYRGRGIKPTVTVTDKNGKKLTKGTDYTVSYKNNTNVGTAKIIVSGKNAYTGTLNKTFTVKKLDLSSKYAIISTPYSAYTYTGSAIKPAVTVKFKDGDVIPTSDYTVSYSNNKNVGVATITVKGKGTNVTGTYKKTFVVKPAKNEITSISTTSGAFKIAWKKGTTGTVGYQVQYSTDKNFEKNVHSWTTTSLSKLSENFSSVPRSGETWYVKVRSFYTKDGKTTSTRYGNYSAVKSIKIK